ncbi:MAG: hypothetical protein QW778_01820 [Candidatus Micrarchaeaceae archaeon]
MKNEIIKNLKESRKKKLVLAFCLITIASFSTGYVLLQTKTSMAILTPPPPGIPGPYYVTAEAKIQGPVADFLLIKNKMSGTYSPDGTYVQWGTNPFYRVYSDNTLQEVYYGLLSDVTNYHASNHPNSLRNKFTEMKNVGATDPTSILGPIRYFGSIPGSDIIESPGTGFVIKYVTPASPIRKSTVNITLRLDPPKAGHMNITDLYPNTFMWEGSQVKLEKFKIGVGLIVTAYVSVTPTPEGSNMRFTVYYNQATSILQLLHEDEYVYITYKLIAPNTAGEYTLPSAKMTYTIPPSSP